MTGERESGGDTSLWLVGAGTMAIDYAKVLGAMGRERVVIGRGEQSAARFEALTGQTVFRGGVSAALATFAPAVPAAAIVAVSAEALYATTAALIVAGVKSILVEKPAALRLEEIVRLRDQAERCATRLVVGYNRRFYSSVRHARRLIAEDGGVTSMNFEFTEWSHVIEPLTRADELKKMWLLGNSSHPIDLAFYLAGKPREIHCLRAGSLRWHPSGAVFAGSGSTESGALFSYQANWSAPGRWGLELCTAVRRLVLRPLETLQVMNHGTLVAEAATVPDAEIDRQFKPGLYRQVEAFLGNSSVDAMCRIADHAENSAIYCKMGGY